MLIGSAALVAIAAVAGPYVYVLLIEGPAPAELELPPARGATTSSRFEVHETAAAGLQSSGDPGLACEGASVSPRNARTRHYRCSLDEAVVTDSNRSHWTRIDSMRMCSFATA